jgi:hypothetical protein
MGLVALTFGLIGSSFLVSDVKAFSTRQKKKCIGGMGISAVWAEVISQL